MKIFTLIWTVLIVSPLVFSDVLVNGKPCDCDVIADCKVGDAVTLEVKLTNLSKNPVGPLSLTVMPYQDYQNGVQNYDLDEAVTFIGSNTFFIDTVSLSRSISLLGAQTNRKVALVKTKGNRTYIHIFSVQPCQFSMHVWQTNSAERFLVKL